MGEFTTLDAKMRLSRWPGSLAIGVQFLLKGGGGCVFSPQPLYYLRDALKQVPLKDRFAPHLCMFGEAD
jgi:hypothetical protein